MSCELASIMNPQLGEDVLHASNLVKEGLQEITLQSLSETGFFVMHCSTEAPACAYCTVSTASPKTWTSRSGRRIWISIWNRILIQ